MGNFLNAQFTEAFKGNKAVVNIRNAGLMIGIELDRPCGDLVKTALAHQLLINVTADKVIRLLPPLIISQQEAQELVNRLVPIVKSFLEVTSK
jgi:acetylornithine/N-succinyldiaminopimelate aminotransferase